MRDYEFYNGTSDPDRTSPARAVASIQGIAAAWLLVLGAAFVALLPCAMNIAEASVVRTAHVARTEIAQLLQKVPGSPQARHPSLGRGAGTGDVLHAAAAELHLHDTL